MSNNNNSSSSDGNRARGRRGAKRRARAPAPGQQPSQKKQRKTRQNRKRAREAPANHFGNAQGHNAGSSGVAATYSLPEGLRRGAIRQDGFDSTYIRKCEFIGNIAGSVLFALSQGLPINPGLQVTFPWLSTVAQSWEKFRFRKLVFHYITRTGNATPGTVLFSPEYDSSDAMPANEQIAADYVDADECPPYANPQTGHYEFALNCARMNSVVKEHFIRTGALPANQDIKLYDPAIAWFFTVDGTAVPWGKLWVEYEIDLFTPQLPAGGVAGLGSLVPAGGAIAAATPFGSAPLSAGSYSLTGAATNVMTFSGLTIGGEYILTVGLVGSVMSVCSAGTLVGLTSKTAFASLIQAGALEIGLINTFTATAANASLVLSVTATTVTSGVATFAAVTPVLAGV